MYFFNADSKHRAYSARRSSFDSQHFKILTIIESILSIIFAENKNVHSLV